MNIEIDRYQKVVVGDSDNPITFLSDTGEELSVVMNKDGFVVWYKDKSMPIFNRYKFSEGKIELLPTFKS